ncbi:unnamed protein product [Macrosiphum euphorbiae]|uniref:Uncharacterized protein n=1 Tax=Macrosiphum euphorbiae TaxID=13131 RepID=A0AAV0X348_9HEMI|nr:unnamed protein product [Macrosiphum euphorbiae]
MKPAQVFASDSGGDMNDDQTGARAPNGIRARARRSHTAGRRTEVGGDGPWDAGLASCTAAAAGSPYMELHYTRRLPPMIFHRNGSSAIL